MGNLVRKPNGWTAALLGFFGQPIGMLSVGHTGRAGFYPGGAVVLMIAWILLQRLASVVAAVPLPFVVPCAVHASRPAKRYPDV